MRLFLNRVLAHPHSSVYGLILKGGLSRVINDISPVIKHIQSPTKGWREVGRAMSVE